MRCNYRFCVFAGPGQFQSETEILLQEQPGARSLLPCAIRPASRTVRGQRWDPGDRAARCERQCRDGGAQRGPQGALLAGARWRPALGAQGPCRSRGPETRLSCRWVSEPPAPLLIKIHRQLSITRVSIAVDICRIRSWSQKILKYLLTCFKITISPLIYLKYLKWLFTNSS